MLDLLWQYINTNERQCTTIYITVIIQDVYHIIVEENLIICLEGFLYILVQFNEMTLPVFFSSLQLIGFQK